jgi:predicted phosphodiesterase
MSKPTYKKEIIYEYLEKYPLASTRGLARIIAKENPLDFKETSARTALQYYRDGYKGKETAFTRSENTKKKYMAKSFKAPETDYEEKEPFIIPKLNNKILLLSDIHLPYHDVEALETAINYGINKGVNAVYLNGDTLDMYQGSRFVKDRRKRQLADELEMGRDFLKQLKEVFNCPIYYKIGNHEDRWEHYLMTNAPELLGIADFKLDTLLRFGEYGVQLVESKQLAYASGLAILHGHELTGGAYSPVNTAKGLFNKAKEHSIVGHHHQTSMHSENTISGKSIVTWSVGCLSGLKPDYMPYNKWNHGFAYIETDGDQFNLENNRIIKGKIY